MSKGTQICYTVRHLRIDDLRKKNRIVIYSYTLYVKIYGIYNLVYSLLQNT